MIADVNKFLVQLEDRQIKHRQNVVALFMNQENETKKLS